MISAVGDSGDELMVVSGMKMERSILSPLQSLGWQVYAIGYLLDIDMVAAVVVVVVDGVQ